MIFVTSYPSPITKIASWLEFLGKNFHLVGCATVCGKIEVMLTPGVQYGLLLPLSIVFALLAILDMLISIKVDLGILGRIKRIVYNIIGLLNWPTVIISVEAPILCGLFGSMIPIVPAYYFFRGFNLEACCSLHPNAHRAQRRREFNSLIARIRDSNE